MSLIVAALAKRNIRWSVGVMLGAHVWGFNFMQVTGRNALYQLADTCQCLAGLDEWQVEATCRYA